VAALNVETKSLDIIGLGVSEHAQLSLQACEALASADVVVGSSRQLNTVSHLLNHQCTEILPKLCHLKQWISQQRGRSVVVLASGDPLFYGIGQWFARYYLAHGITGEKNSITGEKNSITAEKNCAAIRFHPAISSVQTACHLLGFAMQEVEVVSLHGRPLNTIRRVLKNHRKYIVLTDQYSQPAELARECQQAGLTQSTLWVCEKLGYQQQNVRQFGVGQLIDGDYQFDPLHLTVVATQGTVYGVREFPGIRDDQFVTNAQEVDQPSGKGLLSKREVRLNILSLLQPQATDIAWDIGAGCGGVAVEWALWNKHGEVYAVEHNDQRIACLKVNQQRFGVELNLTIIAGRAPAVLDGLPDPSVIFIGGSDGDLSLILRQCWQRLPVGGRLVASAVTETSKHLLQQFASDQAYCEVESVQIAVSRGQQLAGQLIYKPALPVTLVKMIKAHRGEMSDE
jgi:precorrin-6B C5,15-methyltransferase / cobalt-precorrin-6B C5,C15-methyltransferase